MIFDTIHEESIKVRCGVKKTDDDFNYLAPRTDKGGGGGSYFISV